MIEALAVAGYLSLRDVRLALAQLTVITGANGSGKTSLYRALRLLRDAAQGRVVSALAAEGGIASTMWAGPESFSKGMRSGLQPVQGTVRTAPLHLRLGFSSDDLGYAIDLGLSGRGRTRFHLDPEIKAEAVWTGGMLDRANAIAERRGPLVRLREVGTGSWREGTNGLPPFDSMMARCANATDGLELLLLRDRMRAWRFYDDLRTDRDAPARRPQVGTFTPVLAGDGSNVAAAIQTILEVGDAEGLADAIADAFDGATICVGDSFELEMAQHGLLRPLVVAELSDGTLRYLLLTAALLSPRPPELMILNEPEASLHPDLLEPLARLIIRASRACQIVVVSHAPGLVSALLKLSACSMIELKKELGETTIAGQSAPDWKWPKR